MADSRDVGEAGLAACTPARGEGGVQRSVEVGVGTGELAQSWARGVEDGFAVVLADLVGLERVGVDSDFFDQLGADSMVMARFCARVRKRPELPAVSMKDIYQHRTIESLVAALAASAPADDSVENITEDTASVPAPTGVEPAEQMQPIGTAQYVLCGLLQLLSFVGYSYLLGLVMVVGYRFISSGYVGISIGRLTVGVFPAGVAGSGMWMLYTRAVLFAAAGFLTMCLLPVVAKWVLVGRWRPGRIQIWTVGYVRFWLVKTLLRFNPLVLFVGTPLYVWYLRALGAKVGPRAVIFSRNLPVCTDLLTIGADSVIRENTSFQCYRAQAGMIQIGPVTLGEGVLVGARSVLDIDTTMGDGAQLGHVSSLHAGTTVPAGQRWHGSPAGRTELDYLRVAPARCGWLRRAGYSLVTLLGVVVIAVPLVEGFGYLALTGIPPVARLVGAGSGTLTSWAPYLTALQVSAVLFGGVLAVSLVVSFTAPRVLNLLLRPDTVYPLYGLRYRAYRTVLRLTNRPLFTGLFGDSSFIVPYLQLLGYHLSPVVQTGSNFGLVVTHHNPYLSHVGSGTMVADGLAITNAEFSSTSFRLSAVRIGKSNFLGNDIVYPAGGRTGDNCLLATKVMVPLEGPIREGVGLLGSPAFEIPRTVDRDGRFDHLATGDERRRRLAAKDRYNFRTMGLYLFVRWLHLFALTVFGLLTSCIYNLYAHSVIAAFIVVSFVFSALYAVFVERCFTAFRPLQPEFCSIYEPYFWWHERLWKTPEVATLAVYNGTPFKPMLWRLLGARIGARVFDDGCFLSERTLTSIGDDCTLNNLSKIQCHSQEDGTFKSDRSALGAGCTLGVGALVHYGVTMHDGATLAADSFLMKGEEIPPDAVWAGNPAKVSARSRRDLPATPTGEPAQLHQPTSPTGEPAQMHQPTIPAVEGNPAPASSTGRRRLEELVGVAIIAAIVGAAAGMLLDRTTTLGGTPPSTVRPPVTPTSLRPADPLAAAATKVLPSVVELSGAGGAESGVVLSPDGMILTNAHVLPLGTHGLTAIFHNGATALVRVLGVDTADDLAVVQAQGISGQTPIDTGDSDRLRIGQQVLAIGAPNGLSGTVTSGIVSSLGRPVLTAPAPGTPGETMFNAIQTDAAISPGDSGGPLVDTHGQVIGINTALAAPPRLPNHTQTSLITTGFSVPINHAKRIADQLITTGHATRATLGAITTRDATPSGATLLTVPPDSAAATAGLHPGDTITQAGDQPIPNAAALAAATNSAQPGATLALTISKPTPHTVTVTLDTTPTH
jgi:non-ribosomal peptide synthetase-like protein